MAYQRKTRDRWDIETNFGYGWECECSEYTRREARVQLRAYQQNSCGRYAVRMIKRRERLEAEEQRTGEPNTEAYWAPRKDTSNLPVALRGGNWNEEGSVKTWKLL